MCRSLVITRPLITDIVPVYLSAGLPAGGSGTRGPSPQLTSGTSPARSQSLWSCLSSFLRRFRAGPNSASRIAAPVAQSIDLRCPDTIVTRRLPAGAGRGQRVRPSQQGSRRGPAPDEGDRPAAPGDPFLRIELVEGLAGGIGEMDRLEGIAATGAHRRTSGRDLPVSPRQPAVAGVRV